MSVELRNALAAALDCSLSATLLFDYPTVEALSLYLAQNVFQLDPDGSPPPVVSNTMQAQELKNLAEMSEADAESLLLAELNQPKK
jgi:hypothetical protein